jgi:prepilin-type N-terminal cleavage/methylation domain-containing protein
MSRARANHGFTLIELLVAMTLTVIVFGATLSVLDVFQNDNRYELLRNEVQDNARTSIDRLARELRNVAAPTTLEAGALEQAKRYSLTFQTINSTPTSESEFRENRTNAMRVRYCLNDTNPNNEVLLRETQHWTTKTPPELPISTACPDAADWGKTEVLVEHITNRIGGQTRELFAYGPPGALLPASITSVEVTVYTDLTPGRKGSERQLTSTIYLRNQNRTPIASFTATQVGTAVDLNASESVDPNGLALSYKWWDNGTLLKTTAQQYEVKEESPGVHTFKLEVTNPGGLSASTEKPFEVK